MLTGLLLNLKPIDCLRAPDLTSEGRKEVVFLAVERVVHLDTLFVDLVCLPLLAWRVRLLESFFWQGSIGEIEFEDGAEFLREGPGSSMGMEVVWLGSDFDDDGPASRVALFAQAFWAQKCF